MDVAAAFARATGQTPRRWERLARGYANVTWLVEADGARYLLKVPPWGPYPTRGPLPLGASRVQRTVRATAFAVEHGIPTPKIVAHDTSAALLPPFWVQEYVEDADDAERLWPSLSGDERERAASDYGALVAKMHALPYVDDSRPLSELIAERFAVVIAAAARLGFLDEGARARVERAVSEGVMHLRTVEPRLCHTDLYLENVLLRRGAAEWELAALLDFEHARGTDPAEDFTKLRWWNFEAHPELERPFLEAYGPRARHGADFEARAELFCLYGIVASFPYFIERARRADPVRPWVQEGDRAMLADVRRRLSRWLSEGRAC